MRSALAFLFVCLGLSGSGAGAAERPNIIVILADDFGVGDIVAHYPENTIPSPYLDRLVAQGMSFTDAHSPSAVCSPTRYGLLTGRYAWRTRMQEWVVAFYEPPLIAAARPTLPGMLREQGYRTSCVGKWHLGWDWAGPQKPRMTPRREDLAPRKALKWDFEKPVRGGPIDRGFDHYFGVDLPNYPPFTFIENDRVTPQPTAGYEHTPAPAKNRNMPHDFPGGPMAPGWEFDEILPELTRRAVDQVHELAKRDEPFFLYFSMTSPHEPVTPSKDFVGKSGVALIADFLMETDWSAGQVIEAVDRAGIADNTIVIFTADNGHSHYTGWDELVAAGHHPSGEYRGHKGDIWEGGHRVPLVVRWPAQIAAGSQSDQMVSLTDLYATCAELVGVEVGDDAAEDSYSFLPAIKGEANEAARLTMINHSRDGEFAFREGPLKLVYRNEHRNLNKSRGKPRIAELYHLGDDPGEQHDLAPEQPETLQRLTNLLAAEIDRGRSRPGPPAQNDTKVRFEATHLLRWAPPAE